MMLLRYLSDEHDPEFDEEYVDRRAAELGKEATEEWGLIKKVAREESKCH